MILKLETVPGEDIAECARVAAFMANLLTVEVNFKFNGTSITAMPRDSAEEVNQKYWRARQA